MCVCLENNVLKHCRPLETCTNGLSEFVYFLSPPPCFYSVPLDCIWVYYRPLRESLHYLTVGVRSQFGKHWSIREVCLRWISLALTPLRSCSQASILLKYVSSVWQARIPNEMNEMKQCSVVIVYFTKTVKTTCCRENDVSIRILHDYGTNNTTELTLFISYLSTVTCFKRIS